MNLRSRFHRNLNALAVLAVLAFQSAAFAQDKAAKIDQLVSLYAKYGQFNGSALVADNGKVIYAKGAGQANMEWDIPNTPNTRFRLGSITKQFTATLILQLVEQGKIKLDGKLIDLSRHAKYPSARKAAIFWLGQSGDPRAADVYAELLGVRPSS
jgi:CubicO group peptidase (beta-lactamase class C family)